MNPEIKLQIDEALNEMIEEGYVTVTYDPDTRETIFLLTEKGKQAAAMRKKENEEQ
jgi:DNA-binding PadR family transcriptional regulator